MLTILDNPLVYGRPDEVIDVARGELIDSAEFAPLNTQIYVTQRKNILY